MKFHHVALTIKDFSVSIPFYTDLFGFKEVRRFRRDDMGATGVFLQGENMNVELWQFDISKAGTKEDLSYTGIKHIAFTNDDIESVREQFIKKGIKCRELRKGRSGGSYFFLTDPDENQIEFYQPD